MAVVPLKKARAVSDCDDKPTLFDRASCKRLYFFQSVSSFGQEVFTAVEIFSATKVLRRNELLTSAQIMLNGFYFFGPKFPWMSPGQLVNAANGFPMRDLTAWEH